MNLHRVTLETCHKAAGTVVVIDVLRAFTTAAYAFAAGVVDIRVVATVEEALALRAAHPDFLIMGEVGGRPVPEFDLGNSPAPFAHGDFTGRHLIQRTSSGTQGVVCSKRADVILTTGLCTAGATVDYLRAHAPESVTFVITGSHSGRPGDEDVACADYMEALLRRETPSEEAVIRRVWASRAAEKFQDAEMPEFLPHDVEYAVDVDRFDFAMRVRREGDLHLMEAVRWEQGR